MKTIEEYRKNSRIRTNLYSAILYELLDILIRKVAEDMREECQRSLPPKLKITTEEKYERGFNDAIDYSHKAIESIEIK